MADNNSPGANFKPYISPETSIPELTLKSILMGAFFGILFGAASVFLALKAGLTVSASIPIAVLAISIGKKLFKTTILENNIIQTTGSAGESIAAGVVFTLPAFLFMSLNDSGVSVGAGYFNYWTILALAMFGGVLGTLMMIPLRRSLIVQEHHTLPYPEGTACASVLIAGDKGGDFSKMAYQGLSVALVYALLQRVFHVIAETPAWVSAQTNKFFPSATVNADITPEYLGVGYIIGPRIAGILVAGGVLAWLGLIPLIASLVPADTIALQLVKLGYLKDLMTAGGSGNWNPQLHTFASYPDAIYHAYIRQIGAGAVAAGGLITLIKTFPTIISSFRGSVDSLKQNKTGGIKIIRTENDLSFMTVIGGSIGLVVIMIILPMIPGDTIVNKLLLGILVIVFGFFFVTVSSRIVGIIGSSSNPISGMTIATLMGTGLVFIAVGWTGKIFEPMALVVGSMICIAAANAGATSQDLKTGFLVGATPRYQQIALFIGAIVSSLVIGWTIQQLDSPTPDMSALGIVHAIGSDQFPAPQGTLMATLIKGLLSFNLDWQYVLVGAFLSVTVELCGVNALSFAVGAYLPLSTTLPIFVGGAIKGVSDKIAERKGEKREDSELGSGSLFATGLVAGGALAGVIVALLSVRESIYNFFKGISAEGFLGKILGEGGYEILGVIFFGLMGWILFKVSRKPQPKIEENID
jgi:OPT family oligopeptide transporter